MYIYTLGPVYSFHLPGQSGKLLKPRGLKSFDLSNPQIPLKPRTHWGFRFRV